MSSSPISQIIQELCSSISKHYSDPVHSTADVPSGNEAPYFDSNSGKSAPMLSPLCSMWYDRVYASIGGEVDAFNAATELLLCYQPIIKSCIRQEGFGDRNAFELLRNYELMITHLLQNATTEVVVEKKDENHVLCVGKTIYAITEDIIYWTANLSDDHNPILFHMRKMILPYLLRLLEHCVTVMGSANACESCQKSLYREAFALVTVIAVPFVGHRKLGDGSFSIGSLLHLMHMSNASEDCTGINSPISLRYVIGNCWLPQSAYEGVLMPNDFIERDVVDWSISKTQFDAAWSEGDSGISQRMGMRLLHLVRDSLYTTPSGKESTPSESSGTYTQNVCLLIHEIGQGLGMKTLVLATRAFFFQRLGFPLSTSNEATTVSNQCKGPFMPTIKRSYNDNENRGNKRPIAEAAPRMENKMRLYAAIIFFAILQQPSALDGEQVFPDIVPVVLSLLDDATPFNQGVGALLSTAIIKATLDMNNVASYVEKFHTLITRSIGNAVQLCGQEDATILTAVCLAQSKWYYLLNLHKTITVNETCKLIHKAVANLFDIIKKQTFVGSKDDGDIKVATALVVGIDPLLNLLSSFPHAAASEIGRCGLSTMLPLLRWDGINLESRSIQVAALCGILSLMKGAYPVVKHHVHSIMTETFVLLHKLDCDVRYLNETSSENSNSADYKCSTALVARLALHVAASTLVLSDKAEIVLEYIESKHGSVDHIERCREIRSLSTRLISISR